MSYKHEASKGEVQNHDMWSKIRFKRGNETITTDLLHLMKWRNPNGELEELKLYQVLATVWTQLSDLIGLDMYLIKYIEQKHQKDQLLCVREVMEEWLKNRKKLENYPCTWNGIYELLNALNLSTEAQRLKAALQTDKAYSVKGSTKENLSYESEKEKNSSMISFPPLIRPFPAVLEDDFFEDSRNLTYPGLYLDCEMSDSERTMLKETLRQQSSKMTLKFSYIRKQFSDYLKTYDSDQIITELKEILYDMVGYPPLFEDNPNFPTIDDDLERAKSIFEIKRIINSYCSFFNFDLLATVFDHIKYEYGKTALEHHRKDLADYAMQRIYHFPSGLGIHKAKRMVVAIKLDDAYKGCNISHLIGFHEELCELLKLKLGQFPLDGLQPGCICIILHLPCALVKIFPLSLYQIDKLRTLRCYNSKVLSITCEDLHYKEVVKLMPESTNEPSVTILMPGPEITNEPQQPQTTNQTHDTGRNRIWDFLMSCFSFFRHRHHIDDSDTFDQTEHDAELESKSMPEPYLIMERNVEEQLPSRRRSVAMQKSATL